MRIAKCCQNWSAAKFGAFDRFLHFPFDIYICRWSLVLGPCLVLAGFGPLHLLPLTSHNRLQVLTQNIQESGRHLKGSDIPTLDGRLVHMVFNYFGLKSQHQIRYTKLNCSVWTVELIQKLLYVSDMQNELTISDIQKELTIARLMILESWSLLA